jgi:hypothetical protein
MIKLLILYMAVLLLAIDANAKDLDPESFARAYFSAMTKNDTTALAASMHPTALTQFKSKFEPLFQDNSATHTSTELMSIISVKTLGEIKRMPPQAFYAAFFSGLAKIKPEYLELINNSRFEVLGHVQEKQDTHVVYRVVVRIGGQTAKRMAVLSLRRNGDSWGALLTTEAEGIAASLRKLYP